MHPFSENVFGDQMAQILKMMSSSTSEAAYKEMAEMMARVQRHHYEALKAQGFNDADALELVKSTQLFKGK